MILPLLKRQEDVIFEDGMDSVQPNDGRKVYVCDKSCQTAEIVKWSLLLTFFVIFFLWLAIGYWHARRRMRKGLQPLWYHRWIAPKQHGYPALPPQPYQPGYDNNGGSNALGMQNFSEPPPLYSKNGGPPAYQGPAGKNGPQQGGAPQIPPLAHQA